MRFDLDKTGLNPNNLVSGEIHSLKLGKIRAVAPKYGAFYTDSVVVIDQASGAILTKGLQYKFADTAEVSALYNKEICWLILIMDQNVSSTVVINYQVLGGGYVNNSTAIAELYQAYINDDRPVDYANIMNLPSQWPSTRHPHVLNDVYGFGPLVAALERIRMAVVLSHTPELDNLVRWVDSRMKSFDYATPDDLMSGIPNNKVVDLETMMYCCFNNHLGKYAEAKPLVYSSSTNNILIAIRMENYKPGEVFYWRLMHGNTSDSDFEQVTGSYTLTEVTPLINLSFNNPSLINPHFKLIVSKEVDGTNILFYNKWIYPYTLDNGELPQWLHGCTYMVDELTIEGYFATSIIGKPFTTY